MSLFGLYSGNQSNITRQIIFFGSICVVFFLFYLTINEIGSQPSFDYRRSTSFNDGSILANNKTLFGTYEFSKPSKPLTIAEAPKILIWTGLYQDSRWENNVEKFGPCGVYITSQRKYLSAVRIIVFHWRNVQINDLPPKLPGQKWIWFHSESPHHTWRSNLMSSLQSKFDCWATYRQDSDIYVPYGRILPRENKTHFIQPIVKLSSKPKSIAWMVSNCKTPSSRDIYVKHLSEHISVDIYGACGALNCSLPSDFRSKDCWHKMANEYKFYLSFENSICHDYFTEKVINVLDLNLIPIVFGGASYSSVLPDHSFINALDYSSPQQLADYLKYLSDNETAYNEYFAWKRDYRVQLMIPDRYDAIFCQIYQELSGPNPKQCKGTKGMNLVKWWFGEGNCKKWKPEGLVDFHVY